MAELRLELGCRVATATQEGTVRYIGNTEFASGKWVGIQLDTPTGKNDGTVKGVRYFTCGANFGIFVRPSQVTILLNKEDNHSASARATPVETPAEEPETEERNTVPTPVPEAIPENGELIQLRQKVQDLEAEKQEVRKEFVASKAELCAQIESLKESVEFSEIEKQTAMNECASLAKTVAELQLQLEAASSGSANNDQLEGELLKMRESVAELEAKEAELVSQQESVTSQMRADHEKQVSDLKLQIEELHIDKEIAEERVEELELELEAARDETEKLRLDLKTQGGTSANVESGSEAARLKEALEKLRDISLAEKKVMQKKLEELQGVQEKLKEFDSVSQELKEAKDLTGEQEEQIKDLMEQLDVLSEQEHVVETLNVKVLSLEESLREARATNSELEELVELNKELEETHAEEMATVRGELDGANVRVSNLSAELDRLQRLLTEKERLLAEMKRNNKQSEESVSELKRQELLQKEDLDSKSAREQELMNTLQRMERRTVSKRILDIQSQMSTARSERVHKYCEFLRSALPGSLRTEDLHRAELYYVLEEAIVASRALADGLWDACSDLDQSVSPVNDDDGHISNSMVVKFDRICQLEYPSTAAVAMYMTCAALTRSITNVSSSDVANIEQYDQQIKHLGNGMGDLYKCIEADRVSKKSMDSSLKGVVDAVPRVAVEDSGSMLCVNALELQCLVVASLYALRFSVYVLSSKTQEDGFGEETEMYRGVLDKIMALAGKLAQTHQTLSEGLKTEGCSAPSHALTITYSLSTDVYQSAVSAASLCGLIMDFASFALHPPSMGLDGQPGESSWTLYLQHIQEHGRSTLMHTVSVATPEGGGVENIEGLDAVVTDAITRIESLGEGVRYAGSTEREQHAISIAADRIREQIGDGSESKALIEDMRNEYDELKVAKNSLLKENEIMSIQLKSLEQASAVAAADKAEVEELRQALMSTQEELTTLKETESAYQDAMDTLQHDLDAKTLECVQVKEALSRAAVVPNDQVGKGSDGTMSAAPVAGGAIVAAPISLGDSLGVLRYRYAAEAEASSRQLLQMLNEFGDYGIESADAQQLRMSNERISASAHELNVHRIRRCELPRVAKNAGAKRSLHTIENVDKVVSSVQRSLLAINACKEKRKKSYSYGISGGCRSQLRLFRHCRDANTHTSAMDAGARIACILCTLQRLGKVTLSNSTGCGGELQKVSVGKEDWRAIHSSWMV